MATRTEAKREAKPKRRQAAVKAMARRKTKTIRKISKKPPLAVEARGMGLSTEPWLWQAFDTEIINREETAA
jgi:hypothetical protein